MSLLETFIAQDTLGAQINQLLGLAEESMKTMDVGTIKRLRSGTQNFIVLRYGMESHFYADYSKIDSYPSQHTLKEIKGLLLAINDDYQESSRRRPETMPPATTSGANQDNQELIGLILTLFYEKGMYNQVALRNLVESDSDYLNYSVEDAKAVYQKFIDRKIIAPIGNGYACVITDEGKKLYEKKFRKQAVLPVSEGLQTPSTEIAPLNQPLLEVENSTDMHEVFLSYSWDSTEFQEKVAAFNDFLRKNGYHAKMDLMLSEEQTAIDFSKMMHIAIHQSKKVVIILSEGYKVKAENFTGGGGVEYSLLFKDLDRSPQKYVIVAFNGISEEIIPFGLRGREIVDCSKSDWDQKLFSKLSDENRYAFSEVAAKKPAIKKIVPGQFLKDVQKKSTKALTDNATKIKASLRMEKKIKKDLVDHTPVKAPDGSRGLYPGTYANFISSRAIIRSVDDESYPYAADHPNGAKILWWKEHFYDLTNEGIEFWIAAAMGHDIIMNESGYWEILSDYHDKRKSDPRYKCVRIMIIGTIPYYNIVDYRRDGDDYGNDPIIFCHFASDDEPYAKVRYKVYYGEETELPTYELDPAKKTKFDK
jgi:hypothetical protein